MSPHVWSVKNTFALIKLYETNVALWDATHQDYKNREAKDLIISNIATHMNVSTREINRKLHNLRNQLCQELRTIKRKRKRGIINKMCTSNWPYFSALKFIIPSALNRCKSPDIVIQQMILEEREREQEKIKSNKIEDEQTLIKKQDEKSEKKRPVTSIDIVNEEELKRSRISLSKVSNEDDRFGEWVALELQSLRSEVNKRKLKSEIRRAICRIADLDDADSFPSNSSSDPSPHYSSLVSSPTYSSVCDLINIKYEYNA